MTLALQLVTYNSAAYLPFLFASLAEQQDRDWVLYVLDNSEEEGRKAVRELVDYYQGQLPIRYEESEINSGFAGGHQQLFTRHDADLVQLLNPDTILSPDYIKTMRVVFENQPELGSAHGLIKRWRLEAEEPRLLQTIDTLGLVVHPSGKVTEAGSGTERNVPMTALNTFGVSGCLPMYRRQAVEESSHDARLFDPAYVVYKEDIDLAYRLDSGGWSSAVIPWTTAYHERAFQSFASRAKMSRFTEYHSYRNHLWNLITHYGWYDLARRSWALVPFELAKLGYMLVFDWTIVRDTIRDTREAWPELMSKRAFYAN